MKIAFLIDHLSKGGAQRVVSILASRFVAKGCDVTIVVRLDNPDIAYALDPAVKVVVLPRENLTLPAPSLWEKAMGFFASRSDSFAEWRFNHGAEERKNAGYVLSYFRKNPVDVILAFLGESNIAAALCAKKLSARIVIAERNFPDIPLPVRIKYLRNRAYANADVCVFQTKEQADAFPENIRKKAVIIPNPVKEGLPAPFVGERRKVIVNYCGFKEHKNIPLLLDAFAIVAPKYPDYNLELFGYGNEAPVKEKIAALGLADRVSMRPFLPDIHSEVKDAAMFVMSSDYEGMPNALLEAMAIGLPVISTDCKGGGAKALIRDRENGLLTPVGDVDALADAMGFYLEHPETATEYAKKALNVKEELNLTSICDRWQQLFQSKR